jgi:hypothetical protein
MSRKQSASVVSAVKHSAPVVIKLCDYQRLNLTELRAKRDEIDQAIKLVELLRQDAGVP